ncbi:hypothetical protein FI667_g2289, partial [Globisporangium splendens]
MTAVQQRQAKAEQERAGWTQFKDHQPVCGKSFAEVMALLHASAHTRPTRLEFLSVDYFDAGSTAVDSWLADQQQQTTGNTASAGMWCAPREGEFDIVFASQQPTGLRFTESYVMTNLLKLAHIDDALFNALQSPDDRRVMRALLHTVLVRVDAHCVLGAPVNEVTALIVDQLKWLCFVSIEMMMEVPCVSFAAKAAKAAGDGSRGEQNKERRDGIRPEQYLMAINGVPTLQISATSFQDDGKQTSSSQQHSLLDMATQALDRLLDCQRTLRFRDLTAYRREFQLHQPLSPWHRRRRLRDPMVTTDNESDGLISLLNNLSLEDGDGGAKASAPRDDEGKAGDGDKECMTITQRPRNFLQLLIEETEEKATPASAVDLRPAAPVEATPGATSTAESPPQRPHIKRYRGLENCEGTRLDASSGTRPTTQVDKHIVQTLVISDNDRPIGMQLETELMTTLTIFKNFTRTDGPVLACKQVSKGDLLVAINEIPVEEIPTDELIRMLQDQAEIKRGEEKQQQRASINTKNQEMAHESATRTVTFARGEPQKSRGVTSLLSGLWSKNAAKQSAEYKCEGWESFEKVRFLEK